MGVMLSLRARFSPALFAIFFVFPLASCGHDTRSTDPCDGVTCAVDGTTCSPMDGMCHCGDGGEVCADDQVCEAATTTCVTQPAAVCGDGTHWDPGEQAFREATDGWGLTGVEGIRIEAVDFDGDGFTDLAVLNAPAGFDDFTAGGERHTWLLHNTGDGHFEDVTEASGFVTPRGGGAGGRPVEVVAWGDVDNDGDLDAYLGMNTIDLTGANMGETSEIMIQDAPGHFVLGSGDNPVRNPSGVDVPAGAAFVDYDLDGDLDLWVGHNSTSTEILQDRLWRNDGEGGFEDATADAGLETQDWVSLDALNQGLAHSRAWSVATCDLNDDGVMELLAASYGRAPNHLFQGVRGSDGTVTYTNRSVDSGYAYDMDMGWTDNQFARCYCQANPSADGCAGLTAPWWSARSRRPGTRPTTHKPSGSAATAGPPCVATSTTTATWTCSPTRSATGGPARDRTWPSS